MKCEWRSIIHVIWTDGNVGIISIEKDLSTVWYAKKLFPYTLLVLRLRLSSALRMVRVIRVCTRLVRLLRVLIVPCDMIWNCLPNHHVSSSSIVYTRSNIWHLRRYIYSETLNMDVRAPLNVYLVIVSPGEPPHWIPSSRTVIWTRVCIRRNRTMLSSWEKLLRLNDIFDLTAKAKCTIHN